VQAHGFGHVVAERLGEESHPEFLVRVVDAVCRTVFAACVQQVADVVEQRGGDEYGRRAFRFGERGGLQRVFELRDGLAVVLRPAALGEQMVDAGQEFVGGHGFAGFGLWCGLPACTGERGEEARRQDTRGHATAV
jgi:hypothetical protein